MNEKMLLSLLAIRLRFRGTRGARVGNGDGPRVPMRYFLGLFRGQLDDLFPEYDSICNQVTGRWVYPVDGGGVELSKA